MGNAHGNKAAGAGASAAPSSSVSSPPAVAGGGGGGGCPIKGKDQPAATAAAKEEGGCPIKGKKGQVYNVYAQPIDPTNQMPANPNQLPAPGQAAPLSTERVPSQIPKGGTEKETWTYPSPQMFWNALVRKGKAEGAKEEDMEVVVAIHNNMNENTWRAVLEWEKLHGSKPEGPREVVPEDTTPRLSRFMGRPDDLSPKAWIKSLFGHPLPFDRHDWIVVRPDGTEVRYVIDYYHDDARAKENAVPKLHDMDSVKSISVDVRPALDSVGAAVDRAVRMPLSRFQGESQYQPLPFFWQGSAQPTEESSSADASMDLAETSRRVQESCAEAMRRVRECKDEASCSKAAVGLTLCMAQLLCKEEAKAFDAAWQASGGGESGDSQHEAAIEAAFARMRTCLDDYEQRAQKARKKQA